MTVKRAMVRAWQRASSVESRVDSLESPWWDLHCRRPHCDSWRGLMDDATAARMALAAMTAVPTPVDSSSAS